VIGEGRRGEIAVLAWEPLLDGAAELGILSVRK
jgi:hypothetical protein